jgi:chromosome partitioning protein
VVDLDSQSNCTTQLGRRDFADGQKSIIDVMDQKAELRKIIVPARYLYDPDVLAMTDEELEDAGQKRDDAYRKIPNVSIAPCNLAHPQSDDTETILGLRESSCFWLRDELEDVRDDYDVILIDCPGSYGRLTVSAFVCLDSNVDGEVLPAVLCTSKESEGLDILHRKLEAVQADRTYRRRGVVPSIQRILVCAAPTSGYGTGEDRRTFAEYVETYGLAQDGGLILPPISYSGHVRSIHRAQTALPIFAPNGQATKDYAEAATALGFPDQG